MKKFLLVIAIAAVSACSMFDSPTTETAKPAEAHRSVNPKEALKNLKLGCFSVKGVSDSEHGKIYYTESHHLFKYVTLNSKQGDRGFCTSEEAAKAGFSPAPEHFSGSVYFLVDCLHKEGDAGTCHDYVSGIYKSLEIYGEVCGTHPSKQDLAITVEDYASKNKEGMDSSKYEGTTSALLSKYRCRGK